MAKQTGSSDSVAQDQIRAFIERIERMEEEKQAIADDIKEIYAEAKGNGFDTKVLRQVVRIRKQDRTERLEQEALLDLYLTALGMQNAPRDEDASGAARWQHVERRSTKILVSQVRSGSRRAAKRLRGGGRRSGR
jgi:uncharacterized protein (UPF0335 family)